MMSVVMVNRLAIRGSMPADELVMRPDEETDHTRGDGRVHDRPVAEQFLAREHRDDLGDDAHRREQHDVDLRMAEEPEEVLPEDRVTAGPRVVESRAEHLVEQQHDRAGDQWTDRGHEEDARDHNHPHDNRHVEHPHAGRPRIHRGRHEIDAAKQERREFERDGDDPERGAVSRQVIRGLGRQRRVGRPCATERAARNDERRHEHDRAEQEDLIRQAIHPREHHVVAAEHEWDQKIPERGEEHRHGDPEDHDGAVHRDECVVLPGRHPPEQRHGLTGKGQLHPEHIDGETADERHEHPGEQVLHGDDLVVRRPQIRLDEARVVVGGLRRVAAHRSPP
jgi:hypothetical protein